MFRATSIFVTVLCFLFLASSTAMAREERNRDRGDREVKKVETSYEMVHDWKRTGGKPKTTSHTLKVNFNNNLKWLTSTLAGDINGIKWPKDATKKQHIGNVPMCPSMACGMACYDSTISNASKWKFFWEPETHRFGADSKSVGISVKRDNEIDIDLDLAKFRYSGVVMGYKTAANSALCKKKSDLEWGVIRGTLDGLDAGVSVTVARSGSKLKLSEVENLKVKLGKVDTNRDKLVKLAKKLIKLMDWVDDKVWKPEQDNFPNICKSSLTSCANHYIGKGITENHAADGIKKAVNSALTNSLRMKGFESKGDYRVKYSVALSDLSTSTGRIHTGWKLKLSSAQNDSRCAKNFKKPKLKGSKASGAIGDIDVVLPFSLLADGIYRAGKQGIFCGRLVRTRSPGLKGLDVTTLMSATPDGAFSVKKKSAKGHCCSGSGW